MADTLEPIPSSLNARRERAIEALCRHVAGDALTIEEFERRIDLAHAARSASELAALTADLPLLEEPRPAPASRPTPHRPTAEPPRDHQILVAIMGGTTRSGSWTPARRTSVLAVMGGAELDFRDARLEPGVTEVTIFTFWGGVVVTVPPGLAVESGGIAIMGGFEHAGRGTAPRDPDAPVLRINGIALMGGVEIRVRTSPSP